MALTQISTAGVKDDAVTSGKIPANAVGSSELADNAVDTAAIATDAVTGPKIADDAIGSNHYVDGSIDAEHLNSSAVTTSKLNNNAVDASKLASNAVTTAKIADQAVTLDKLPHGTSSNDGKFLRANNGADPSFETVSIPAGTTINSNADNRFITGSGTANTLNAESEVLFDATSSDMSIVGYQANRVMDLIIQNTYNSSNAAGARLTIESGSSANTGPQLGLRCGTQTWYLQSPKNAGALDFHGNGTRTFRLRGDGNVDVVDGDLVIGTAGHGISFSADSNQSGATGELLDDYETGTYTAHFAIEGQSNMSMSGRIGLYTRVGNVVTVMGGGQCASTTGAGTGNAIEFSNLPFPVFNTSGTYGHPFPVKLFNMDSSGLDSMSGSRPYIFKGRLFNDGTHGRIEGERSDSAQNAVNSSLCLSTNTEILYMFTYITDA